MRPSLLVFVLLLANPCGWLMADVKSASGTNIHFDLNNDGMVEMRLNTTGLGIGTEPSGNLHVSGNIAVSEEVFLGAAAGNSSLQINGSLEFAPQSVSANTTLEGNTLIFADTSSANITLTLPYAGNVMGRMYKVKKTSNSNFVYLTADNTIDDQRQVGLGAANTGKPSIEVMSDGAVWHIMKYTGNVGPYGLEDLLLWYKLDEKRGVIAYDSGPHGIHATLDTDVGFSFQNNAVAGQIDGALDFDGSNDIIAAVSGAPSVSDDFSFGAWIQCDTTFTVDAEATSGTTGTAGSRYAFYPVSQGGDSGIGLSVGTNAISVYEHGASFLPPPAVYNVAIGSGWNHIFVTAVNGTATIWLNGVDVHEGQDTGRTVWSPDDNIGGGSYGYHNGKIDDYRVYKRTLSAYEVMYLYNGGVNNSSDNLIGHWTLDETTGTNADDSSTANNDGTLTNMTFSANTTTGQISNALSFDGTDDHIVLTSHLSDYSGLNHGTISAWVKTLDATQRKGIVALNDASENDRFVFEVSVAGKLQLVVKNGGSIQVILTSTAAVNDGNWYHVVAWSSGSEARLYINGAKVTSFDTETNAGKWFNDVSNLDTMFIGVDNNSGADEYFDGSIDDVRIYDRPLSSWEIQELYNAAQ